MIYLKNTLAGIFGVVLYHAIVWALGSTVGPVLTAYIQGVVFVWLAVQALMYRRLRSYLEAL